MSIDAREQHPIRVMVFVDFWNFQLLVNDLERGFPVDWKTLGPIVARTALEVVDADSQLSYQGMNVYAFFDPYGKRDEAFRRWATNSLDKFSGVQVAMIPRQRKRKGPVCPACHEELSKCYKCGSDMRGTEEKGVDTRIVTDMIKLAWADNYDVAVLLSSDKDFVPVVEFLSTRGIKTIHAAFPPQGSMLTQHCWGNISIPNTMEQFRRV